MDSIQNNDKIDALFALLLLNKSYKDNQYDSMDLAQKEMLESIISKEGWASSRYAYKILHSAWQKGEQSIADDSYASCYYAEHVIGGKWERGERAISKNAVASLDYAKYVIKGRWETGETSIYNDKYTAKEYEIFLMAESINNK